MAIALLFLIFCVVMVVIMLIRNVLVFIYLIKALNIIKPKAYKLVEEFKEWHYLYVRLGMLSYNKMMFQFSNWTFKDFYPDINEW